MAIWYCFSYGYYGYFDQTGGVAGKKINLFQGWENHKQKLLQDMKDKPPFMSCVEVNNLNLRVHKNCKICIYAKSSDPSMDFSGHLGEQDGYCTEIWCCYFFKDWLLLGDT